MDNDKPVVARQHSDDAATIYSKGSVLHIKPQAYELLENYSHVPSSRVECHVTALRDRAFSIHPYPCIAHLRFLALSLREHPAYPTILHRLCFENHTFLDLGCCFGQEIRSLVHDGAPAENLYGLEMVEDFVNLGYELFCDKETLRSKFLIASLQELENGHAAPEKESLLGKIDVVYASSFFHLFPLERQIELAKIVVRILRPRKGSCILGRQLGSIKPGAYALRKMDLGQPWRHDVESLTRMWEDIGRATGTQWKVEASLDEEELGYKGNEAWGDRNMRRLRFAIWRL